MTCTFLLKFGWAVALSQDLSCTIDLPKQLLCFVVQLWTICPFKKYVYNVSRIYTGQLYKMHFLTCVVQSRVYVCAEPSQAHNLTSLQLWTTWSTVQPGKILHVLLPVSEWPELCVWTNMRLKFTNRHVGNLIYLVLLLHSHSQFATLITCMTPIQLEKKVDVCVLVTLIYMPAWWGWTVCSFINCKTKYRNCSD